MGIVQHGTTSANRTVRVLFVSCTVNSLAFRSRLELGSPDGNAIVARRTRASRAVSRPSILRSQSRMAFEAVNSTRFLSAWRA